MCCAGNGESTLTGDQVKDGRVHLVKGLVCHTKVPKGLYPFLLDFTYSLQHCSVYRRNGQTSESYGFLSVVTSHDLL